MSHWSPPPSPFSRKQPQQQKSKINRQIPSFSFISFSLGFSATGRLTTQNLKQHFSTPTSDPLKTLDFLQTQTPRRNADQNTNLTKPKAEVGNEIWKQENRRRGAPTSGWNRRPDLSPERPDRPVDVSERRPVFQRRRKTESKKNKKKARLEVRWLGNRDGLSQRFWNFRGLRLLWNCRFGPWFWTGVPAFLVLCVVFHFSIFQFFHFWKLGDWVWPSPVGPWWL